MMMVITSLIVSPLSRWRCFLPSLNRGCWAFNSGKVPWQNSSQSTKSCTMSISVLLFVVGTSGANLSRFLPKKESRDSTTELISLLCFNFYIELTFFKQSPQFPVEEQIETCWQAVYQRQKHLGVKENPYRESKR